jgi:hypothetical protein
VKFLFPALCRAVLLGGFARAQRPANHPVQPPAAKRGEPFQEDPREKAKTRRGEIAISEDTR